MKKILSIMLASCMALTLTTAVFAGPADAPAGESTGTQTPAESGGESGGEQPGGSGGEQPGGSGGEQPGGSGGEQPGGEQPGGSGGGKGQEKETISADPLSEEEVIIITPSLTKEKTERDLTGLYTGEDAGSSIGDITVSSGETWHVEDNCVVDKLEIEDGAIVEADFPVIVFFSESNSVNNGDVIGNVQFVNSYDEVVAIIHTNDTHGVLDAEASVKGLKNQLTDSDKYSLVLAVNAGDIYAGGYAVAHIYEGEFIPYVMNDIYDFITWGNNDAILSSKGIQSYFLSILGNATDSVTLVSNQRASEEMDMEAYAASYEPAVGAETFVSLYPEVLSLNEDGSINYSLLDLAAYKVTAGDNVCADGAIVETANGTKLGIFGESTQGGSLTDAYFTGGMSTIDTAKTVSQALLANGADSLVMIGHIGWFDPDSTEGSSNDTNSALVAKAVPGLDAIIDGHTHSVINEGEGHLMSGYNNNPAINQASCKGAAIGVLYLYIKDGKVIAKDCENLVADENGIIEGIIPDEAVQAEVDNALARLDSDGYVKAVASTEYFLNGERLSSGDIGGGTRANETNLGDLVADAILASAQKLWTADEIKIALYPGYWIRASIAAGDITLIDALSVFANPLKIYYAQYSASELVDLMTTSCSKLGEENNSMFQVAGLVCTYDPATKAVVSLEVDGEKIYENGEYLVDDIWTVGCAAEVGGADLDSVEDALVIIHSNTDMAKAFCEYLEAGDYTIYPDVMCPAGRVVPAE